MSKKPAKVEEPKEVEKATPYYRDGTSLQLAAAALGSDYCVTLTDEEVSAAQAERRQANIQAAQKAKQAARDTKSQAAIRQGGLTAATAGGAKVRMREAQEGKIAQSDPQVRGSGLAPAT